MPVVEIIDLRNEKLPLGGLSETLRQAMIQALEEGGQVILLLNRRGFHTFVLCPECGNVVKCRACDVAATYHKERHILICHTCDAERACPTGLPVLRRAGLALRGHRHRAARARDQDRRFPTSSRGGWTRTPCARPAATSRCCRRSSAGKVQILLGTQMIAKGLDFPNVTLVGVVNADTALHLPDFRAAERTFQLVAQVAGRTGRGDRLGRVLVQTYSPDHPAIRSAIRHDYEGFAQGELPEREKYGVPPYGRLVRLIARGPARIRGPRLPRESGGGVPPGGRPVGPHPRPGPGPHPQDPRPLSVPPPVALSQFPPTPDR